MLKMLSLFSGIGSMDLAAKWASIETIAFCEIEKFCQAVLRKNFGSGIVIFDDVRELTAESLREHGIEHVDIVAGGFPCQDISAAGKRAGIDAERSGLWSEMFRIVGELRPRFVIVENVSALLLPFKSEGKFIAPAALSRVCGDLAEIGYDAEWETLSACAFGAPHTRERVFVVAYPSSDGWPNVSGSLPCESVATRHHGTPEREKLGWQFSIAGQGCGIPHGETFFEKVTPALRGSWDSEPAVCRVADELPDAMDRVIALGNSIAPEVAYPIFEAIANLEAQRG